MISIHSVKFLEFTLVCVVFAFVASGEEEWRPEKLGDVVESTLVRYYLFDLKNPEEFENGEAAEVVELGPFTYREKRVKQNMKRVEGKRLQYDINWSMHYLPELTGKGLGEETEFTTVNIPYVTLAEGLANQGLPKGFNDILMDEVVEAGERVYRDGIKFGESTFYGYNVSIYTEILDDVTQGQTEERYPELANGKFAFFKNRNGTIFANYTVLSTKSSPFGRILEYKGNSSLGFWPPSSNCDDVSGAFDFFTFPTDVKRDEEYSIFLPENCRSMKLRFVQEDIFRGIPVYTFKFPLDQFHNDLEDKRWGCYCLNFANASNPQCLDEGLMDYSGCSKGAPLVGSFPHFLHANPRHLNSVKGLMPNKSLHESEVMVEPITGTPLYVVRRFQLNVRLHSLPTVTQFENMTERIIPVAWFEHILEVPSTVFTQVREKLDKLKEMGQVLSDKDKYEPTPIDEIGENTLFAGRSGFPVSGSEEDSQNQSREKLASMSISSISSSSFLYVMMGLLCLSLIWTETL